MMKYIFLSLIITSFSLQSCKTEQNSSFESEIDLASYQNFGEEFELTSVLSSQDAKKKFNQLNDGDSIRVQFKAPMKDVCKAKGCWMVVDLDDNQTARVSFKDYGFFVPKDMEPGTEVILNGWAHLKSTSIDELKHLAEDAGKSQEEIELITEPEVGYSIVADGVFMKNLES